ncbi:MAG: hypothetical protein HYZ42_15790 [Bacteroidetes bacterium]|nr:hypothetical protein [Bacteroidota bacterium]
MLKHSLSVVVAIIGFVISTQAQIITHEDSLAAGLQIKGNKSTVISGYGEITYTQDFKTKTGVADLRRNILFLGYRFNDKLTFFSEMEMEHAKIESGAPSGEISMEQCFVKFDVNRLNYIVAGLFIPRIGIINENHLPTTFNGTDRPVTERMVIPATWREIGVAYYGQTRSIPGLNYNVSIMNGLNAENFSMESGIKEGRGEGALAQSRQKAIHASLLYFYGPLRLQASGVVTGSVGLDNKNADYLGLNTGMLGTTTYLGEMNCQYRKNGWAIKGLFSYVSIPEADKIMTAYANNIPKAFMGTYAELAKDLWYKKHQGMKQLSPFVRYEYVDMNMSLSAKAIENKYYTQHHLFAGLTFMPARGVAVKADYHYISNGVFNQQLITVPQPLARLYYTQQHFLNLSVNYSF